MDQITGEQSQAAIFAADGKTRHRLVRATVAAGVALLVSWLVALALGVLGGFGSLPGLPGSQSNESHPASSQVKPAEPSRAGHAQTTDSATDVVRGRTAPAERTSSPAPVRHVTSPSQRRGSTPKTTSKAPASPTHATPPAAHGAASNGRALGTTKTTTGKPLGSPGNGSGGSGAPGQLR
jgi:hypothetical protein